MDLQPLFRHPITQLDYLDPGYESHASDVWLVETAAERVVVRLSRPAAGRDDDPFCCGCRHLFGIDPQAIFDLEIVNALLHRLSPIAVPLVLRKGRLDGRPYVVVEAMPGRRVDDLRDLPDAALYELGRALAAIHGPRFPYAGHPSGSLRYPIAAFHARLTETLRLLVEQFCGQHAELSAALEGLCTTAEELPPPPHGSLIMVDLDPTQFLGDGRRLTALVDTEAYAIGPRELDFIALEYVVDQRSAQSVMAGYSPLLPLPDLRQVRPVYRYLYRLLEVQGDIELGEWLQWPAYFDPQAAVSARTQAAPQATSWRSDI
jgi:aminoglycoside phosphotransferase (APT) family kinase protein